MCKESQKSFHGINDLMNLCATGAGLAVSFGIQFFVWDSIYCIGKDGSNFKSSDACGTAVTMSNLCELALYIMYYVFNDSISFNLTHGLNRPEGIMLYIQFE